MQGTALYVGAVLGTGMIALPGLAAHAAGPASLLAWLGLVLLSIPLAATFASLGARYPDSGGVSTYARAAFGDGAAQFVGWCFYFAIPVGALAAALIAGDYVAAAGGGGRSTAVATAALLLVSVVAANARGIRVSARVQLGLAAVLLVFLAVAVLASLPHARASNLHPFAPHGLLAVGTAGGLLVWSFAGWEAITSLVGEFRRPTRDLARATAAAVAIIGVLYLAVAWATVTVLGADASRSAAPLGDLMARGLGGNARWLAAGLAVLLTLGVLNADLAGAAKLGAALGRDGALPTWLALGSQAGEVPRRSLALTATLSGVSLTGVSVADVGLSALIAATSALLVAVYAVCTTAAVRLLPRGSPGRAAAAVAAVAVAALLVATGRFLLVPVALALVAATYRRLGRPSDPAAALTPHRRETARPAVRAVWARSRQWRGTTQATR